MWWQLVRWAVLAVVVLWLVLVGTLAAKRPDTTRLAESLRLLPDVVRLTWRLARAPELPRSVRWGLWLVLAYMALPIDLIPDVVPVLGYADDVIVVALGLRFVARRAGTAALVRHWPGSADGLGVVLRLAHRSGGRDGRVPSEVRGTSDSERGHVSTVERFGGAGSGSSMPTRGTPMTDSTPNADTASMKSDGHEIVNWADLGQEMWAYLTGKGAAINYSFVDMSVEVPRDVGPDAPRATWKLNGTLRVTTSDDQSAGADPHRG